MKTITTTTTAMAVTATTTRPFSMTTIFVILGMIGSSLIYVNEMRGMEQQQQQQQEESSTEGGGGITTSGLIVKDEYKNGSNNDEESIVVDNDDQDLVLVTSQQQQEQQQQQQVDEHEEEEEQFNQHQQQQQSPDPAVDVDENDPKKYFILHIGPPKTASTTIQYEMLVTKNIYLEPQDNYYIIGKRGDKHCMLNKAINNEWCNREVKKYMINATLQQQDGATTDSPNLPECWNDMIEGIATLSDKQNLILSSESINIPGWSTSYEWYTAFDAALSEQGYKLVVVAVYRRLYQWLPSVYNQHTKHFIGWDWSHHNIPMIPLIFDSKYVKYADNTGRPTWFQWITTYLDEVPDYIETRILNLHTDLDRTVGTKFFCDMIPNTPNTCQYMLDVQNGIVNEEVIEGEEKKDDDDDDDNRNLRRHLEQNAIDEDNDNDNDGNESSNNNDEIRVNQSIESGELYYDFLSVAAYDAGYIDSELYDRHTVNQAIGEYQTISLQRHPTNDFPLICANDEELNTLLDASIYWEQKLIPNMISSENEHRQAFWIEANDNYKFCTINTTATLELSEWKNFFIERFSSSSSKSNELDAEQSEEGDVLSDENEVKEITIQQQDEEQDEELDEEQDEVEQKYFILHIGPPKTASTTIQYEMGITKKEYLESQDKYYIIGKRGDRWCKLNEAINNEWCNREVKNYMTNSTLQQQDGTTESPNLPECWNDMIDGITELNDKQNLILSSESINLPGWSTSYEWYTAFNDALSKQGYKLIVVGVYRRLYQWLPSVHNQHTKHFIGTGWTKHNEPLIPLIFDSKYVKYADGTGRSTWFQWITTYLEEIPNDIETRILNLHTELDRTVGTKFFCDMIPNAYATCQYMLQVQNASTVITQQQQEEEDMDDEDSNRRRRQGRRRRRRQLDLEDDDEAYDDDHYDDDEEVRNKSLNGGELYFDFLSVAAADAGYINIEKYTRSDVNDAIDIYQTTILQRKPNEFPLYCASIDELNTLIDASVYWEQQLIPTMMISSLYENEHRQAFWNDVNENKYCTINTTATLELTEWKEFFINNYQQ